MRSLAIGPLRRLLPLSLAVLSAGSVLADDPVAVLRLEPVDADRSRTVPLKIYRVPSTDPRPVIVFSHGLGGSRENSAYLGEHWAAQGYVAVFVQHLGSDESVWKEAPAAGRLATMRAAASAKSLLERLGDIPFVLDQLEKWNVMEAHPLRGALDLEKIGMCGHSFGAVTTQAMMGQRFPGGKSAGEARFDAFLAMSPSTGRGFSAAESFGHVDRPVLCMTGTEDDSPIQPEVTPESRREVYGALPPGDKFQLVFDGAGHFAFSDSKRFEARRLARHHEAILILSTRFWDAYLKGDGTAESWLKSTAPRDDAKLVEADRWEWK